MAGMGQFRRDSVSNWASINPLLAEGELGLELVTNKMKFGDGILHWNSLPYANIGNTGPTGPKGDTGTGLSRVITSTIDFGSNENTYVTKTINDALIISSSTIIIQPIGEDYALQEVTCGLISISNGVSYTIFAKAPIGASGIMNINILIF